MKTKYFSIFLGMVLSILNCGRLNAQRCISFDYDNNGNMIERFVYDNCSIDEIAEIVADVEEYEQSDAFMLYPNPTNSEVNLDLPHYSAEENVSYSVFDVRGSLVQQGDIYSKGTTIYMDKFVSGVYLFVVNYGSERYSKTVVKL